MANLDLRPLQLAAIEKVQQAFRDGYKNVMLQAPCGFGKTELATAMLHKTVENKKRGAFICDRLSLIEQTGERFDRYDLPFGVMQSNHWRSKPWENIQLCSIQTLHRREWPEVNLIMADEAHVLPKALTDRISKRDCYTVGLSATPLTKSLGKYFDIVINAATTNQLIQEKLLVPFKVFAPSEPDMTGVKITAGEYDEQETISKVLPIVGDCVKEYTLHGNEKKFIAFAVNVAHATELQRQFAAAGIVTSLYTYRESDDEKADTVSEFRKPDSYIRGLISIESLTRGFDVADIEVLILARPLRKALHVHIQMIGRVLRTSIGTGKEMATILDHSGNCLRFWDEVSDFFEYGVSELDDGKKKDKKKPDPKEKKAVKCPKCHHIHESFICPSCGYKPEKPSGIQHEAGTLKELLHNGDYVSVESRIWPQICGYARSVAGDDLDAARRKALGYYMRIVGKFPVAKFEKTIPVAPTREIVGKIKQGNIAFAKARRA
jgi:superfamily II DNA or RNA helicase